MQNVFLEVFNRPVHRILCTLTGLFLFFYTERPLRNRFCSSSSLRPVGPVPRREGDNFNHPDENPIGTGIHTLSISRMNPTKFGGGLKFEPVEYIPIIGDTEIGQKEVFCKGLTGSSL